MTENEGVDVPVETENNSGSLQEDLYSCRMETRLNGFLAQRRGNGYGL